MNSMKEFLLFVVLMFLCGTALADQVSIIPDNSQTTVGQSVYLYTTVLDENSTPRNNTLVNFSTTLGNLSAGSAYTNSSGVTVIGLNSTIAGTAIINASVGSVYNTTNVTFLSGKTAKMEVNISQNFLVVGNTTMVNLTVFDQYNNVNSTAVYSLDIKIFDIFKNKTNEINLTRMPYTLTQINYNRSSLTLINSSSPSPSVFLNINSTISGNFSITAIVENITRSFNITFIPAAVYEFNVFCYGTTCTRVVNQTVNMTIEVLDMYGNPAGNNTLVYFNASAPLPTKFNSPIEYNSLVFYPNVTNTTLDGKVSTVFRTDKRAGDNTIYISAGSLNISYIIPGEADVPQDLFLSHSPDLVNANNKDAYRLTAQVTDQFRNPVLPVGMSLTKKVHFVSTSETYVLLNDSGVATTLVGPTLYIQTVNISAFYNDGINVNDTGFMNSTLLSFVPGNLSRFIFYANPDTVIYQNGQGNHNASIILKALDEWGHPIPGINVTLNNTNITLGNLTVPGVNGTNMINAVTDSYGAIQAQFTSNISVGNDTITAVNGSTNASLNISIRDKTFISVSIDFEPKDIMSGQIVNITTIISVEGYVPDTRPPVNVTLVLDNTGSMDPDYYAGTPLDIMLINDISGSMDPDYMDSGAFDTAGFTPFDYSATGSISSHNWWNDTFVVDRSPVNDFNIRLYWYTGQNSDLRLQLISPSGKIYGYLGNATGYDYYTPSGRKAAIWIDYNSNYPYPFFPDTDTIEMGTWSVRIYGNFLSGNRNFDINTQIERVSAVKIASKEFNNNMISNDRVGLISFGGNDVSAERINQYDLTYNISYVNEKIDGLWAYGGTPTAFSIRNATNYLKTNNTRSWTRPYIILLSDGQPTIALDGDYDAAEATFDAVNEANIAKNTFINGNSFIRIYAIGFGADADNETMEAIASPDSYYYAATTSQLREIYNSIAQQISDFDINMRQYGSDGFTPYNYYAMGVVNGTTNWTDTIYLNDNITDLKVNIDNPTLNFTLTSPLPNSIQYPTPTELGFVNRSGYYYSGTAKYIWIAPVSDKYDPVQDINIILPKGNWTLSVNGSGTFNITTYIDRLSAVKIGAHAFISNFDATLGDRAGLVTYSNIPNPPNSVISTNQSSYLLNGSIWDGYFVGNTPKKNYTLNFTGYNCTRVFNGIGECYVTVNGRYTDDFGGPSGGEGAKNYSIDITDFVLNGSNTLSFYNYSYIYATNPRPNSSIRYINILENGTSVYWFQNSSNAILENDPTSYFFNVSFYSTFNLTWPNSSDNLDLFLYQGATLISKSINPAGNNETLKATIYPDKVYYVEVNGTKINNETNFTITANQTLTWNSYTANITAPLEVSNITKSFDMLNTSIDTMTAVGLTAIDEGLFLANNEFSINSTHRTMVLMTDGLDNAGYRSLLNEITRAKNNRTVIYTIGLGTNRSEIDPVLNQIANMTGGKYYFAPNTTELKSIFQGIASYLTAFTASNATLNILLPRNYSSGLSLATSMYVTNSSNSTTNKSWDFIVPTFRGDYLNNSSEPVQSVIGENMTVLSWNLGNLTIDDKWGVWYQLKVEGAGYVPLILPGSNVTYLNIDANQTIAIINLTNIGGPDVGGNGTGPSYVPLDKVQLSANPTVMRIMETSVITLNALDVDGNYAITNVTLSTNLGSFNNSTGPQTLYLIVNGNNYVNFTSGHAGRARIKGYGDISIEDLLIVVKPRGMISIQ